MKKPFLTLLGFVAFALAACDSAPPATSMPPVGLSFAAQPGVQDKVQGELNAQRMGHLAYQKFKLLETPWVCFENCPTNMSLSFSDVDRSRGDLLATLTWGRSSQDVPAYIAPDYKFSLKGNMDLPCRMVTLNYVQCRAFNGSTGITETLGLKRAH